MNLDIRLPIGLLFIILGTILSITGLFSDQSINKKSLDLNINLWWGLLLFIFGVIFVYLTRRTTRGQHLK